MKNNILAVPLLALCASCSALGTALTSTGETITTLSDPTATPEEQDAAVGDTAGVLARAAGLPFAEETALVGIATLVTGLWRDRKRRKRGEPTGTDSGAPPLSSAAA